VDGVIHCTVPHQTTRVDHRLTSSATCNTNDKAGGLLLLGTTTACTGDSEPEMSDRKYVGEVTNYFGKIGVAAIKLSDTLRVGNKIYIEGKTTSFEQEVTSMQVDRKPIEQATAGQEIAIKVIERVREKDKVYLIS